MLAREVDSARVVAAALFGLGRVAQSRSDHRHAIALFLESLTHSRIARDKVAVIASLEEVAAVLLGLGDAGRAARLGGVTDAQRAAMGMRLPPMDRAHHERMKAGARCSR